MPNLVAAAGNTQTIGDLINIATQVVMFATPIALILLFFFWNMSQLVIQGNNPEKIKDAHTRIIWSIIGLFVVFSLTGILVVLQKTFFGETNQTGIEAPRSGGNSNTDIFAPRPQGTGKPPLQEVNPSPSEGPCISTPFHTCPI